LTVEELELKLKKAEERRQENLNFKKLLKQERRQILDVVKEKDEELGRVRPII
jgi:hypothetical protein